MDHKKGIESLRCSVEERPLALFLGAGVLFPLVPLWEELLNDLIEVAVMTRLGPEFAPASLREIAREAKNPAILSVYERASLVKALLGGQYTTFLQKAVYSRFHREFGKIAEFDRSLFEGDLRYAFLASVLALCELPCVGTVLSYNYDDIVVRALRRVRGAYSVFGPEHTRLRGLPVYHLHGFIPDSDRPHDPEFSRVVLSRDEYFEVMLEPFSWQTTAQLHYLQNATCLFLGVSLTDVNMLRMLNTAYRYSRFQRVYCLAAQEEFGGTSAVLRGFLARAKTTLADQVGVNMIWVDRYADLAPTIRDLIARVDSRPSSAGVTGAMQIQRRCTKEGM